MDKSVINNESKFKNWLPKNKVTAVDSYMTYLRNASDATDSNSIDDFLDKIVRKAIEENLSNEVFSSVRKANDSRSAVKKYWDFLRHLGKDMKSK